MERNCTIWSYITLRINTLKEDGRTVTAANYARAQRCLRRYCPDENLSLEAITEDFVKAFNEYLENTNIQKPTISFYNRVLRSIYNQAAGEGLVKNTHPFDAVYTKVENRFAPVRVNDETGARLNLDSLPREELLSKYKSLQLRYNALVGRIAELVRV